MQKAIILLIIFVTLTSGKCTLEDLTIERQNYSGTNLRIDGVYYNKPDKAHFFLYRNGVFFHGSPSFSGSVRQLLKFHSKKKNYSSTSIPPYFWGVFRIENNEIVIEKWMSGDSFKYRTHKFGGKIINDTTLLLNNHPYFGIGVDTFYFYQCSSKPDSTNNFIK